MSWKLKLTASSLTPAACRIFQANISVYTWLLNWNSLGTLTFFISNPSWILISRFFCSLFENTFKLLNIWSQGLLSPRLAHTQWLACAVCNSSSSSLPGSTSWVLRLQEWWYPLNAVWESTQGIAHAGQVGTSPTHLSLATDILLITALFLCNSPAAVTVHWECTGIFYCVEAIPFLETNLPFLCKVWIGTKIHRLVWSLLCCVDWLI